MRCSCPVCTTYMVHAESHMGGCVCPHCGARCFNCLGTDTVIEKGDLSRLARWTAQDEPEEEPLLRTRAEELREAAHEAEGREES